MIKARHGPWSATLGFRSLFVGCVRLCIFASLASVLYYCLST